MTEMAVDENKFADQFKKNASLWKGIFKSQTELEAFNTTAWQVCPVEGLARDNATPQYKRSLWQAIVMIASLGLKPGKQYGHIDMHIEKLEGFDVVVCRPMYQGYLELAY